MEESGLAQLALSYKHQLGVDDMLQDLNIAAGKLLLLFRSFMQMLQILLFCIEKELF